MTGFGSATVDAGGVSVTVEARSVNARHLRVDLSLPAGVDAWEPRLRALADEFLERGSLSVSVEVEGASEGPTVELDRERIEAYLSALRTLRDEYGLPGQPDLPLLLQCGPVLRERKAAPAREMDAEVVEEAARRALTELVEMREEEGRRLARDLRARVEAVDEALDRVEELAPKRLERERRRLLRAVEELVTDHAADDDRLAREVALLADKWDVGEEVVRARSHLEAFRELLEAPGPEAVGKRLKFLVQELHREINTTGAKANDAEISRAVVEMKNEVERMREQIENVE